MPPRVTTVRTDEVRRLTIGLVGAPGAWDAPGVGEYLSADLNILRAEAAVQYRVADPVAFSLKVDGFEPLLRKLAEASLSRSLSRQTIDETLREGRTIAALEAESAITRGIDRYGLGISVLGVSLTDVRPPSEVAADFASAQSARSARERRSNEAKSYATATLTRAKSEASARIEQARGKADQTLTLARGRAARFLSMLAGVETSRALTVRRIYLDTLRELLPKVGRKIVLAPEEPVDLSVIGAGR